MKIIILSSAFSGLTQRVQRELLVLGHELLMHIDLNADLLRQQIASFQPDLVICPFLTQRVPQDVWDDTLFLVVHPGIEGDRGPSSLDWAIQEGWSKWGVTLLQADEEMDAGDIWGTAVFPLRQSSKLSTYKREVSTAAVELIKRALVDFNNSFFKPRALNYNNPQVKGTLRPLMRQVDRLIDWQRESAEAIVAKLNAADTSPGVKDEINGIEVRLYGATPEPKLKGKAGEFIAICNDAVCRATVDGAVWLQQIKCMDFDALPTFKLPATHVLEKILAQAQFSKIPQLDKHSTIDEIRVDRYGDVAYVYFNFYNGAFSTRQCQDLKQCIIDVKNSDAKFVVFMGGEEFWSNGIHLNCIEAAADPAQESWENIQAIDEVVLEMITMTEQVTISALRNNSGAGGSIMALACDEVIVRRGTVHNPHYLGMGLYGSEYWTYLLPKQVGHAKAQELIINCEPLLATEAIEIGFADVALTEDWVDFHQQLFDHIQKLSDYIDLDAFLAAKDKQLQADMREKPLHQYRDQELEEMHKIFFNPNSDYHLLRHNFVYKKKGEAKKWDVLRRRERRRGSQSASVVNA